MVKLVMGLHDEINGTDTIQIVICGRTASVDPRSISAIEIIGEQITQQDIDLICTKFPHLVKISINGIASDGEHFNVDWNILSKLTGLYELHLKWCDISDISFIKSIPDIEIIDLRGNLIEDISPISVNRSFIEHLDLSCNNISNLGPLAYMAINVLEVGSNPITDISPLSNVTELCTLCLNNSPISDISSMNQFFESYDTLDHLNLRRTCVKDISPIANFNNLEILDLSRNKELDDTAIHTLGNIKFLNQLYLDDTNISDISDISKLDNLGVISIRNVKISDFSPLFNKPRLQKIVLNIDKANKLTQETKEMLGKKILFDDE